MTGATPSRFAELPILQRGAGALGVALDARQLDLFRRYGETLLTANERMNLTAITDPAQVQALHFLDALTLVPTLRDWCREAGRDDPTLLDVGSGSGVPGLLLKIALPGLRVTLLDATGKRVRFLQGSIADLDLRGIGAVQGRAEELGRDRDWREQFDLVTARALARLPTLLEWCLPFARVGGLVLAPKAGDLAAEIAQGARAAAILGGSVGALRPVTLPELPGRAIVPIAKVARTPGRYPRGAGLPAKEPLGDEDSAMTGADLGRWEPLHPETAADLCRPLPVPWWIAGGWALDLFAGRQTREHADLDLEVLRRDQLVIQRHLAGWDLHTAANGELRPWRAGEELGAGVNSIWCRPAPGAPWAVQVMFAEAAGERWCYRRHPAIERPLAGLGLRTGAGIPYLAPEVQLLYKARAPRPKDDADFATIRPLLDADRRGWLAAALDAAHPGHRWLAQL